MWFVTLIAALLPNSSSTPEGLITPTLENTAQAIGFVRRTFSDIIEPGDPFYSYRIVFASTRRQYDSNDDKRNSTPGDRCNRVRRLPRVRRARIIVIVVRRRDCGRQT